MGHWTTAIPTHLYLLTVVFMHMHIIHCTERVINSFQADIQAVSHKQGPEGSEAAAVLQIERLVRTVYSG